MSSKTKNGVRQTERGKENGTGADMSMDVVKLLKTQDVGYLQTILQQTKHERERVEKDVILAGAGKRSSKKKEFDDDGMEIILPQEDEFPGLDMDFSDDEGLTEDESEDEKGLSKEEIQLRRRKRRAQEVLQNRLDALIGREKDLTTALSTLQDQRAKMNNTVGGVTKSGVKFKVRERKR